MKWLFILAVFLMGWVAAYSQAANPPIVLVTSTPSGSCAAGLPDEQTTPGGILYSCQSGTWTALGSGGGGSGTVSGQAAGVIGLATNATTTGAQSHIDDGNTTASTITSSEPINVAATAKPSAVLMSADNVAPIVVTGYAGWGINTTLTTGGFYLMPDAPCSGLHTFANSAGIVTTTCTALNGAGAGVPTGPTSSTNTDFASFSGTSGQLQDSGVASTNVPLLNAANTFSVNAAASTPAATWTGALFSGTGTTSTPIVYINGGSVAPTNWATGGTQFGINSVTAFGGNFIDTHVNGGGSLFKVSSTGTVTALKYVTNTQCAAAGSAANPSAVACSAAASGLFSCATNASGGTCVVSTTAVGATSVILVQPDSSLGTALSVTCNTTADSGLTAPRVSARSANTSFTIQLGTFSTNPLCFSYTILNN